jgi:polysaccharide export outer membrane protein
LQIGTEPSHCPPVKAKKTLPGAIAAVVLGCADLGQYVWADSLQEAPASPGGPYLLAPGDLVWVRVYNEETASAKTRVRPDGRVTVPFVNDVAAAGHTTEELAKTVQERLRDYIKGPVVTVSLEEAGAAQLSVLGEVARPGVYPLDRSSQGVLRALAAAGGLTEFAHKDRIFVLRAGTPRRIRFTLEGLSTPGSPSARFRLQNDDVVQVQ